MPRRSKGGISVSQLKGFIEASYKPKREAQEVDGYKLDPTISTKKAKVYVKDGKAVVSHAGTYGTMSDWANNLLIPVPYLYKKTPRYKTAKEVQEKAIAKYGKKNIVTTGHSQSGNIVKELAKEGLTDKAHVLNPALLNPFSEHKGVQVIRSKGDVVSKLARKGKTDIDIESKSFNPLAEHGADILDRLQDQELGGKRYIRPHSLGMPMHIYH